MTNFNLSPGDFVFFKKTRKCKILYVKMVNKLEGDEVTVSGIFGHSFNKNTGLSTKGKESSIHPISIEDACNFIMERSDAKEISKEQMEHYLKERALKFKVHEIVSNI